MNSHLKHFLSASRSSGKRCRQSGRGQSSSSPSRPDLRALLQDAGRRSPRASRQTQDAAAGTGRQRSRRRRLSLPPAEFVAPL